MYIKITKKLRYMYFTCAEASPVREDPSPFDESFYFNQFTVPT